jgi:hypothetical protein
MGLVNSLPYYCTSNIEDQKIAILRSRFCTGDKINFVTMDSHFRLIQYNKNCDKNNAYYFDKICYLTDRLVKKLIKYGYENIGYELFVNILENLTTYYMNNTLVRIHSGGLQLVT